MEIEQDTNETPPMTIIANDWSPRFFHSLRTLQSWGQIFLFALIIGDIGIIITTFLSISKVGDMMQLLQDFLHPSLVDQYAAVFGLLRVVAFLASIVTFLAWFWYAYNNTIAFDTEPPPYEQGWALGAWFVPIINLWRPLQMIRWIAERAGALTEKKDGYSVGGGAFGSQRMWLLTCSR